MLPGEETTAMDMEIDSAGSQKILMRMEGDCLLPQYYCYDQCHPVATSSLRNTMTERNKSSLIALPSCKLLTDETRTHAI
jgi:hypothetical protein